MKTARLAAPLLISLASFNVTSAELNLSGFGTLAFGSVVDGDGYIAEYPNLGVYEDEYDFGQETRLGLQGTAVFNDEISGTLQLMTRANNDYDIEVEWLYVTYQYSSNANIQAGRMRMPVYYYSDFMDVGFAFPWVRIPSDTYSLDVTNFNGIKSNWSFSAGSTDIGLSLYLGKEENPSDELMSYLFESFTSNIDRDFEDIFGVVFDLSYQNFIFRTTFTQADMVEQQALLFDPFAATVEFDIEFIDYFFQYSFENGLSLMAEYNEYEPFYKSYFTSVVYQKDAWQYYLFWSQFDLDLPFEKHDTTGIGFRYDLGDGVALKMDLSSMNDEGFIPVDGGPNIPNPVYHADDDGDGDVMVLTLALDFVF